MAFPLTVYETVRLGLDGCALPLEQRRDILVRCLRFADIGHLASQLYQTLSGGEQRRVHFARVLAQLEAGRRHEPRQMLFLDEPIAGLDIHQQFALMDRAREIAGDEVSVLAIVHDLTLAARYADTLIVMDQGRIVAAGSPSAVLTRDLIATVFRVDIETDTSGGGAPVIMPRRRLPPQELRRPV